MRIRRSEVLRLVALVAAAFFYCEFLIYYLVLIQCGWPSINKAASHIYSTNDEAVYAMFLADTHLLGKRNGHWFDKLRREWQMHRAFQTALTLHQPEVIFVLGDIFDEGLWCSGLEFNEYVEQFYSLFAIPKHVKLYVVSGNHDVGFHYKITPYLSDRFSSQMKSKTIEMITMKGNHFILINSMAMERDGCFLCASAENALLNITSILRCSRGVGNCHNVKTLERYSRPILLQHFPLYRISDEMCTESDAAPLPERLNRFRERWECLSRESTEFLVDNLQPRLALGGHTHHSCFIQHNINKPDETFSEYSIPSFSWRNRNDPSFLLGVFSPDEFKISKCRMPKENTVILTYVIFAILIIAYIGYIIRKRFKMKYRKYF
ncbi:per1-like protein PGAP5 [Arctopsyche grandis]|uniref:per1-like protein PGAP5 n=1 Tax=Arctopsyche grandis TaxID=121162 RepID=UPI00406D6C4E